MPRPRKVVPSAFTCPDCRSVAMRVYLVRQEPPVKVRELRCRHCGARIITRETVINNPPKIKNPARTFHR